MNKKIVPPILVIALIAIAVLTAIYMQKNNHPHQPLPEPVTQESEPPSTSIHLPPIQSQPPESSSSEPHYTLQEFEAFTQNFQNELPPMKELREQPKHSLHPGLVKAYTRSGKIARAAIRQPELRDMAFTSLEYCANLNHYDTSVRAMCLRQHRKIREATQDHSFDEKKRFKHFKELNSLLRRSFDE